MRSKLATIGVIIYLIVAGLAFAYSLADNSIYSIAFLVLVAWPWAAYLPEILAIAINALIVYFVLAGLALLVSHLRQPRVRA